MTDNDKTEPENEPNFDRVEYEVAIETIAKLFTDLRQTGLSRMDAAAIVASVLGGTTNG